MAIKWLITFILHVISWYFKFYDHTYLFLFILQTALQTDIFLLTLFKNCFLNHKQDGTHIWQEKTLERLADIYLHYGVMVQNFRLRTLSKFQCDESDFDKKLFRAKVSTCRSAWKKTASRTCSNSHVPGWGQGVGGTVKASVYEWHQTPYLTIEFETIEHKFTT